jgi:hypothetical protein
MKAREVRGVSRVVADHLPWRGDLAGGYDDGMIAHAWDERRYPFTRGRIMSANRQVWLFIAVAVLGALTKERLHADEPKADGAPVPVKKPVDLNFKHDSFTFVRVKYTARRPDRSRVWMTDYPDSDRNLSARFAKDTGLTTNPDGKVLSLTDPTLKQYPFIYIIEAGSLKLDDGEARSLRDYLLGGGFLMVDDFWGEAEWKNFYENIKRVFPEREPVELPLDHEVFHCFYDLKEKPQIPSIHAWLSGLTTERWDAKEPRYRGIFDDKGRMMAIICHNTDVGDGWESRARGFESRHEIGEVASGATGSLGFLPAMLRIAMQAGARDDIACARGGS